MGYNPVIITNTPGINFVRVAHHQPTKRLTFDAFRNPLNRLLPVFTRHRRSRPFFLVAVVDGSSSGATPSFTSKQSCPAERRHRQTPDTSSC
jgi:hypothetical protein